jgi:hypothetical protein
MTPKEKAIELRNRHRLFNGSYQDEDNITINTYLINKNAAKKSALVTVDELLSIKCQDGSWDNFENNPHHYYSTGYWQQVKAEIEKL